MQGLIGQTASVDIRSKALQIPWWSERRVTKVMNIDDVLRRLKAASSMEVAEYGLESHDLRGLTAAQPLSF